MIQRNGGLAVVQGPQNKTFAMTHYDRDVFTYVPEGESATGPAGMIFTLGADGTAAQLLVENLDINGEGVFSRKAMAVAAP